MHWRKKWQPTPVFLPGGSQGWGSLVGCRLWGRTESDTTEAMQQQQQIWEEATRGNIFLDQEASKTALVQRVLLLTRPGVVTAYGVACQWNLC